MQEHMTRYMDDTGQSCGMLGPFLCEASPFLPLLLLIV
jgi:hypothetical protein